MSQSRIFNPLPVSTLLLNERGPVLSVQMILGHQHVDTTLGYGRLYDGRIAEDYFKAMDRIEGVTSVSVPEEKRVFSPGELIVLLNDLTDSPLTQKQKEMVSSIQEGVFALVNRENYVLSREIGKVQIIHNQFSTKKEYSPMIFRP